MSRAKSSVYLPTDKKRVGTATFPFKVEKLDGSIRWHWVDANGVIAQSGCSTSNAKFIESDAKTYKSVLERLAEK